MQVCKIEEYSNFNICKATATCMSRCVCSAMACFGLFAHRRVWCLRFEVWRGGEMGVSRDGGVSGGGGGCGG
jgi:hypothetical protein